MKDEAKTKAQLISELTALRQRVVELEIATAEPKQVDITERRQAERRGEQRSSQLEALRQIGLELTSELHLDTLLHSIVSQASKLLEGAAGSLFLYRPERDLLELLVDLKMGLTGFTVRRGEGLSGKVWVTGQPLIIDNYQTWPERLTTLDENNLTTAVGVPIQWGSEFLGVLVVVNRPTPFEPADGELLSMLATQAAVAIRNSQLINSLQQSEARYRMLFEDSPLSLWEEDFSGVKTYLEQLRQEGVTDFERYFEQHPQEIEHCAQMVRVIDVNQATLNLYQLRDKRELGTLGETFNSGEMDSFKAELLAIADGKLRFENENISDIFLNRGEIFVNLSWSVAPGYEDSYARVLVSLVDITERKRAEEENRRRLSQWEALRQISLELTAELDLDTLLNSIVLRGIELLEGATGSIYLYRPEQDALELILTVGEPTVPRGVMLQRGEGMSGKILETGQPQIVDNYQTWSGGTTFFKRFPFNAALAVPIQLGQEFLGTLHIANRSTPFVSADVELLNLLATQAAIAIRNARLVDSLRESEERFRSLFDDAPISLWEEDFSAVKSYLDQLRAEGVEDFAAYFELHPEAVLHSITLVKFIDVNQACLKLCRVSDKQELLDVTPQIILEASESFKQELLAIAAGKTKFEIEHVTQTVVNAEIQVAVSWSVAPGYEESYAKVLVGVVDITQLKQTEEALRQSEARYRTLVEQIPAIIYTKTLDEIGRVMYVSPQIETLLGYPPKTWLDDPQGWLSYLHPDDHNRVLQEVTRCRKENVPFLLDYRLLDREGRPVWMRDQTVMVRDKAGQPLLLQGIIFDITESKQLEQALRESEQRHRQLAQENARLYAASQQRLKEQMALLKAATVISASMDLPIVLKLIAEQMSQAIDTTSAYICSYDSKTMLGTILAEYFSPQASPAEQISDLGVTYYLPHDLPVAFMFMQSDKLAQFQHTDDSNLPEAEKKHLQQFGACSTLIIRLQIGGELLGYAALWESRYRREFTAKEIALCHGIVQQAAIAIQNARLLQQTRQDAETKTMLLEEVNHRVKNNLSTIIGLLYAERRHSGIENQAAFQAIMQDLVNRVQGLSTVHSLLSAAEWGPLSLSDLARQIVASVLQSLPSDKRVLVKVMPSPVRVTPQQANNLALVINELTVNTVKYGVPEHETMQISIRIDYEDNFIIFEFKNNGPNYPVEVLNLERYNVGIYLIKNIVSKGLRGEIKLHNDAGAVAIIRFPVSLE